MLVIILAALGGAFLGVVLSRLIDLKTLPFNDKAAFQKEQEKIIRTLQEKKDAFDKEIKDEEVEKRNKIAETIKDLDAQYELKEKEYKDRTEELQKIYDDKKEELNKQDRDNELNRAYKIQEQIEAEQKVYNEELNKLSQSYKDQKESLDKDFFAFSEQISMKRAALNDEINAYEQKQKEIIARFKADEEKKQQADFYKIKISDNEKNDIIKLKNLSTTFSKPEILLKLLYEVYYKARLEEVFKRVLGENKSVGGIYKITNVTNNKVYIGKTTKFLDRFRTHAKRGCGIERITGQLYDAMFEEGLENFTWEIIEVCGKEEQTEKEKYWTEFYKSNEWGYNIRKG